MALTPKQQLFVKQFLISRNATQAARAAGYSETSAHAQGPRLLAHDEVRAAIKTGLAVHERRARAKVNAKGLTYERWLSETSQIALSNMNDFMRVEERIVKTGADDVEQKIIEVIPVLTKDRPLAMGGAIKSIKQTANGIGIELHDKKSALRDLGEHFGWLKRDMPVVPTGGSVTVNLTLPDNGRNAPVESTTEAAPIADESGMSGADKL